MPLELLPLKKIHFVSLLFLGVYRFASRLTMYSLRSCIKTPGDKRGI